MFAYATQDVQTGEWVVGLVAAEVEEDVDEVLVPTSFASMDQTLAELGVRCTEGWQPWSGGLRVPVEKLI